MESRQTYDLLRHFPPLLSTPSFSTAAFSTLAILPVSHFLLPHFQSLPEKVEKAGHYVT